MMTNIERWAVLVAMLLPAMLVRPAGAAVSHAKVTAVLNTSALQPGQQGVLAVVVDVAKGLHAQSHTPAEGNIPLEVTIKPNDAVRFFDTTYPEGEEVNYPLLGRLNVYTNRVVVFVPFEVKQSAAAAGELTISGSASFQICNDNTCFAPESPTFEAKTSVVPLTASVTVTNAEIFKGFDWSKLSTAATRPALPNASENGAPTETNHSLWWAFSVALVAGVILNVMPCVLPVLPLKAIGFYEASKHNRAKSLSFGLAFSAGIVATFGLLTIPILAFGQQWGQMFSYAWFTWTVAGIMLLMALGLFGLFTVALPQSVYMVSPRHDTYLGNVAFGALTAVLSTPCTGPFFGVLITFAISKPTPIAVLLIMGVGVGMALPYLVLSGTPNLARKLPRTGPWSEIVKQYMGVLMLAVATYFACQRLTTESTMWYVIFAVLAAGSVFLIVRTAQLMPRARPIGVAFVVGLVLAGASFGATWRLAHPLAKWIEFTPETLSTARRQGRVVLVDFTANWCANCKYIEATVYSDKELLQRLGDGNVLLLRADLTRQDAAGWPLQKQLSPSGGIPLTAVYGRAEQPLLLQSIYTGSTLRTALDAAGK